MVTMVTMVSCDHLACFTVQEETESDGNDTDTMIDTTVFHFPKACIGKEMGKSHHQRSMLTIDCYSIENVNRAFPRHRSDILTLYCMVSVKLTLQNCMNAAVMLVLSVNRRIIY